jgi:predicted DsbA family dithiol-disulfide isomerase
MAGAAPSVLRVDLVSDVVCPWCYVGLRGFLIAAAQRPHIPVALSFRPYQLDPDVPPEGADRQARLLAKFGGDAQRLKEITAAVVEAGEAVGIRFAFDRIARTPNTLDCHRLLRWAQGGGAGAGPGAGLAAAEALFQAYFLEGEDLTQRATLVAIARGLGLDGAVVEQLLESGADVDAVQAELEIARRMGITGVPCFIFDSQLAVMGAQAPERFVRAIDTAWEEAQKRAQA